MSAADKRAAEEAAKREKRERAEDERRRQFLGAPIDFRLDGA